ncbi:MAG TPA: hypothetical protein VFX97_15645 [Pyrinomonadaceae bacterium]|nr:hypothetical protein [Pyrinomonadaceae bacterium]
MKPIITLIACLTAWLVLTPSAHTQNPKIVTAAQANGVYSSYDNEIRILALGKNKLKVQFDGVYHTISKSVNTGYASGEASIEGNVAVLELREWGPCKITMVWLRGNRLKVTQEGDSPNCGFGHNVRADGTYRKIRGGKPKFEPPPE